LGIIGCGAIGEEVALYCARSMADRVEVSALFDIDPGKSGALNKKLPYSAATARSVDELFAMSEFIVEAASVEASAEALGLAVRSKKGILIMSSGGVIEKHELLDAARSAGIRVIIPSGAVIGLDGMKAASVDGIDEVILTTRKPTSGLKGAPYVVKNNIDLDSIDGEKLIFEGTAGEAIEAFPKNINVSATLSLAGIGAAKTRVRIVASSEYTKNVHEIEVNGRFGSFSAKAENYPLPHNPRTSHLAALSAIAALKGMLDSVSIGT
jgi:aspartate dehydrogenase